MKLFHLKYDQTPWLRMTYSIILMCVCTAVHTTQVVHWKNMYFCQHTVIDHIQKFIVFGLVFFFSSHPSHIPELLHCHILFIAHYIQFFNHTNLHTQQIVLLQIIWSSFLWVCWIMPREQVLSSKIETFGTQLHFQVQRSKTNVLITELTEASLDLSLTYIALWQFKAYNVKCKTLDVISHTC